MERQKHRILLDEPIDVFSEKDADIVGRHYVNLIKWSKGASFPLRQGEAINYIINKLANGNNRVQLVFDFNDDL